MRGISLPFRTVVIPTVTALILVSSSLVSMTVAAEQQVPPPPPPPAGPTPVPPPPPTRPSIPPSNVRVTDVYRYGKAGEKENVRNSAGINDRIVVRVRDLQSLVDQAKCLDQDKQKVENCDKQEIALYLDGRKIEGIVPESGAPRPEDETVQFHLDRNPENDEEWADILGAPVVGSKFFKRPTAVSVGLENGYPEPTEITGQRFHLIRIRSVLFWPCLIGLLVLLYLMLRLAKRSGILRDVGPSPTGTDARGRNKSKPFSLARCQMAFWFFWVIASFVFIWLVTGAYDIITASTLALIGIGAGTALGAAAIDAGKREETDGQLGSLEAEKLTLGNEIAALDAKISANPPPADLSQLQQTRITSLARLNLVDKQITELKKAAVPQESQGFLKDILTDATGVSFHRFQMFVWAIVLGFLFIYSVWNRLSMPEFSTSLLALQGISAGTYLGFKIPEKQA